MLAAVYVYVGTFTSPSRNGRGEGIYVFRIDEGSGDLAHVQTLEGVANPSFLALHPSRPLLFCNNAEPEGGLSAFAIDEADGRLSFLNRQGSGGAGPAHVSVHRGGRWVFGANFGAGSVCMLPLQDDGRLGPPSDVVQHRGPPGPVRGRQDGPHAHQIVPAADGRFVLVNDLGLDRTYVYLPDTILGKLVPNDPPFAAANPGAGPRHLAFHPSRRFLYVLNEIDSTVTVFAWDGQAGAATPLGTVSTLPPGHAGDNSTAQIVAHPNGRYLYASNRGHDSIALFSLDHEGRDLSPVGHVPTGGRTPRNFNLDPTARFLYAANQDSDTIVVFRLEEDGRRLEPTGHVARAGSPVCLVFLPTR
jgi:6-phosphogluconolactonase